MDDKNFDDLWDSVIQKHVNNTIKLYSFRCEQTQEKKEKIFRAYNESKFFFKSNKNEGLIDRHKIAASVMYAILFECPFSIPVTSNNMVKVRDNLANEYLAIRVGIHLIALFRMKWAIQEGKEFLKDLWEFHEDKITYPDTGTKETYLEHFCKLLRRIRIGKEEKSSLLAHCLFHIEAYYELYAESLA